VFKLRKRYTYPSPAGKIIFVFFLLLFVTGISAQEVGDSAIEKVEGKPLQGDDEQKPEYFLKKWENNNDSVVFSERQVPDRQVKKMQEDDDFWYANALLRKEKLKERDDSFVPVTERAWFQTLLWLVIIAGFAGVIIWWLAESNVSLFRKKNTMIEGEGGEPAPGDIFAINYQKEIDRAIQQGNYRLATRMMFLRLLKDLSEKKIIQYTQDKTNFDYLSQLHSTRYYHDFFRITRNYEFSWYGQFEVDEKAFRVIQQEFNLFNRQLK
jgi:hypothetical protein